MTYAMRACLAAAAALAIGLPPVVAGGGKKGALTMTNAIGCYGAVSVDYRRAGKPALKLSFGEPGIAAMASKPEGWGFYQFPSLSRLEDGRVHLGFSVQEDSVRSYGKGGRVHLVSADGAGKWQEADAASMRTGLLLPNGDRLAVTTPEAKKVSELKLPEPAGTVTASYGNTELDVFRLQGLPPELRTVHQVRRAEGTDRWKAELADLLDPQALRYTISGLFPVVWWGDMRVAPDGSLLAGIYPAYLLRDDGTVDAKGGVFFYRSTDNGHTWTVQGRIRYQPDLTADPKGNERGGFTEPAFEILADGSLLCVMRTTDGVGIGPMYASRSKDLGRTWSKPAAFTPNGVLPQLLRLENGVLVLASGRPGVQVRFCADGRGETWSDPFEMVAPKPEVAGDYSCGYTSLLATGPDSFLIAYSDFKHRAPGGAFRKAIKVREVRASPEG